MTTEKNDKQDNISVGCVPTTAVASGGVGYTLPTWKRPGIGRDTLPPHPKDMGPEIPYPQKVHWTRDTLPPYITPAPPPEGTCDQGYPTLSWKGHGTNNQKGTWDQRYPAPPNGYNDKHLWKHYLTATSLAVGKNTSLSSSANRALIRNTKIMAILLQVNFFINRELMLFKYFQLSFNLIYKSDL